MGTGTGTVSVPLAGSVAPCETRPGDQLGWPALGGIGHYSPGTIQSRPSTGGGSAV
jgi:hypothetical protein